jgi:hypothetical protein
MKYEGRILTVKDDDIDLIAEHASAIDHMGGRRLISPGQVRLQQFEPDRLARIPLCSGMAEALSGQSPAFAGCRRAAPQGELRETIPSFASFLKGGRRDHPSRDLPPASRDASHWGR